jgi:ubiquinone/menaquinone biosynthesis C-methylase UbiE
MTDNHVVIEAFTELAPQYEETVDRELRQFWGVSYEALVDRLVKQASVNRGDMVLDVATGTALIPRMLAGQVGAGGRVVGLDITLAMLDHGRNKVGTTGPSLPISLVCASAAAMPFAGGVFDVAICGFGTHHMDVSRLLSEMRRVLRAGGSIVVADVGIPAFWRSRWGMALLRLLLVIYRLRHMNSARVRAETDALSNIRTAGEWQAVVSDAGFTQIVVLQSRPRRPWYPCALMVRAVAEDRGG